jgi:transposase, IS30 family
MKKETDKKRKKRKPFRHLQQSDRDRIEALLDSGHTQEQVATILQFDAGAISRELRRRRQKDGRYVATVAQHKAGVKRSNSKYQGMKIEAYPDLKTDIIALLKQLRSPDEIAGRMKLEKRPVRVNVNAIYRWLHSPWGQNYCRYLCTKRYKKRKQTKKTKREMIPNRVSLEKRPKRGEHAEGDLFVSPTKTGEQRSGAIVCVPSAQLLVGTMIENKKPATMVTAVRSIDEIISVDDYTWDNGMENRYHQRFGTDNYFADPHAPWQKPHVENGIGLLRRWFIKKGTNLMEVSERYFQECLYILNSKWRKSLGYRSAYEVALERGIIQKIPVLWTGEVMEIVREINRLEVAFH